eukprot:TRINITY_DN5426_c0_g1_i1.p1 TRINITY_DN5426_c0_g1~~TRINITY_DN5426_c0_g1_i1.p1  ORF type:complete len:124 (+),score=21.23 TRINITY_DN5426_c0_g1_i1:812-1183(+)
MKLSRGVWRFRVLSYPRLVNSSVYIGEVRRGRVRVQPRFFSSKSISIEDVEKHNSENDCWMIIHDKVYDISDFVDDHPGGEIIMDGAGADATEMFEEADHTDDAYELLKEYCIGYLSKPEKKS